MVPAARLTRLAWDEASVEAMAPSAAASPWSLVEGTGDNLANSHLWQIEIGGTRVLLAVRGLQMQHGNLLEVVGMRSTGERFRAGQLGPVVEQLVRDCYPQTDLLSMCTRHEHLVRACERQGWTRSGAIVNKPMRLQ